MEMKLATRLLAAVLVVLHLAATCQAYYNRTLFKSIVYNDNSNDDAIYLRTQELLKRSGYDYEEHYVVADDGYITQLIRIVNPLADRAQLRKPPVMLYHGANIDSAAYLAASSIQHHPEKYPRSLAEDGPITSSNRSLGFTLANNGFDVWLIGQRGSNRDNQAYTDQVELTRASLDASFKPTEAQLEFAKTKEYWLYGLDDIIEYDIRGQIDRVRQLTGSQELTILGYSLSTPTTMAFLAAHPDYARSVRNYIQLAPAIAADHFTFITKVYFEKLCPRFPTRGIGFTPTFFVKPAVRRAVLELSKSSRLRYGIIRQFLASLFGPSQKYHTNLERNLLSRVFQPVSFKSVKHYCQNSVSKELTKFDYGSPENRRRFGQSKPPRYDISSLEVQNYIVVSGTMDTLADSTTVDRLIKTTRTPKPVQQIICPGFNHADLIAAVESDRYVNLPLIEQLNRNA